MGGAEPDIVITAYSKRFDAANARLERIEGGYVNDKADAGGPTKYGISLRFLLGEGLKDLDLDGVGDFDLDMDGDIDIDDIKALTPVDAKALYHRCFWKPVDADSWTAPIGEMMFDQAVNGGLVAAKKLLQQAINRVWAMQHPLAAQPHITVDGALGPATRAAFIELPNPVATVTIAYRHCAEDRYRALVRSHPAWAKFLDGWVARARHLGEV